MKIFTFARKNLTNENTTWNFFEKNTVAIGDTDYEAVSRVWRQSEWTNYSQHENTKKPAWRWLFG